MNKRINLNSVLTWTALIFAILALTITTIETDWIWRSIYYRIHSIVLVNGYLTIIDETQPSALGQTVYTFGNIEEEPHATITITDVRYFRDVVSELDVGLGESYVAKYWETEDIAQYLRLLFINYKHETAQSLFYYLQFLSIPQWANIYNYYQREHTIFNDAENIHHHYDWGVKLFESFLDDTMTYTAANFDDESDDLEQAQVNKVDRLVKKANIKNDDNVLEIGFGFGYLASYLLNNTNASSVTGITLSHDQLEYAHNRYIKYAADRNLSQSLKYLYRDYRHYQDGKEKFDAIISVEMIEAIGHEHIDTYFETVSNSLKENGRFVIQYGAYSTWAFPSYYQKKGAYFPTFVVKHIFPAHFEPDEQEIHASALKYGLELVHSEKFGLHYAKTLRIWLDNLIKEKQHIVSIFGEEIFRTFKYYLAWSQAVYQTQILHEIQAVFVKSDSKDIGRNLEQQVVAL